MTCKTITKKRGKYCFRDEAGILHKFFTLEEAIEAGGVEKKVAVSGVPYKVNSSDVSVETDDE